MRKTILFKKVMVMIIFSPVMVVMEMMEGEFIMVRMMMTRKVKCYDEKPRIYILLHPQVSID